MTRYPPNVGIVELRKAIATAARRCMSGGRPVDPDQIIVSSGSKQSIFNACFMSLRPARQVLIPSPAWVSYPQIVHLCRAEPVPVPGDVEWGLKVSVRDLDRQTTSSPAASSLLALQSDRRGLHPARAAGRSPSGRSGNEVWIISDEIYRRINYGTGPAPSFLDLPDELLERLVVVYGASKAYAMTGWRIGAALAPPHADQGHGGAPVPHHDRCQSPGPVGRGYRVRRRAGGAEVARMVAAFRRPGATGGRTVPPGCARHRIRGAARRVLFLLPGGRHPERRGRFRDRPSASS